MAMSNMLSAMYPSIWDILFSGIAGFLLTYDAMSRLCSVERPNGTRIEHTFDKAGNRKSYLVTAPASKKSENFLLANGQNHELQLSNSGSAGASYDWYRNGLKFTTTSEPRLPVSEMTVGRAGTYRVMIREAFS